MKFLRDSYEFESGLRLVDCLERLDLKSCDLQNSITPLVLVSQGCYYEKCTTLFYPIIGVHLSSLICCGFDRFYDFVKEFNSAIKLEGDDSGRCEGLCNALTEYLESGKIPNDAKTIISVSELLQVLKSNRDELMSFVECLKDYRPVEMFKDYSPNDIASNSLSRFFVGGLRVESPEYNSNVVMRYGDYSLTASVNVAGDRLEDEEYVSFLKSFVPKIESFELHLIVPSISKQLNLKTKGEFFSMLYDLIYLILKDWGV